MKPLHKPSRSGGFTLVEMMVSVTIIGVVVSIACLIVFQSLSTYYYDVGRVEVNQDMRKLTRDMTTNAVFSNYFLIYPNFSTRTITTGTGSAAVTIDDTMGDGLSGDMVLFITDATDSTTGVQLISTIVGYYRDGTTAVPGPVRTFSIAVPVTSTQSQTISTILNTYQPTSNQSTNTTVIPLAEDIGSGLLFYNFYNHSVMLKSEVLEPGTAQRMATSTYNFTVSPRG